MNLNLYVKYLFSFKNSISNQQIAQKILHVYVRIGFLEYAYLLPLIYGLPDAFGASARPMKPANATIVNTYGKISK